MQNLTVAERRMLKDAIDLQISGAWDRAHEFLKRAEPKFSDSFLIRVNLAICKYWMSEYAAAATLAIDLLRDSELTHPAERFIERTTNTLYIMAIVSLHEEGEPEQARRVSLQFCDKNYTVQDLETLPLAVYVNEQGSLELVEEDSAELIIFVLTILAGGLRLSDDEKAELRRLRDSYKRLERGGRSAFHTFTKVLLREAIPDEPIDPRFVAEFLGLDKDDFHPDKLFDREGSEHPSIVWKETTDESESLNSEIASVPSNSPEFVLPESDQNILFDELKEHFTMLKSMWPSAINDYREVLALVRSLTELTPTPFAALSPYTILYRARINNPDAAFNEKRDLSYCPNPKFIRSFGRVNTPSQCLFYSATDPAAAMFETIDALFPDKTIVREGMLTVGCWRVIKPVRVGIITFSEVARGKSQYRHEAITFLEREFGQVYGQKGTKLIKDVLRYISERFADRVSEDRGYWLTAAYFNSIVRSEYPDIMLVDSGVLGLVYPSVKTELEGENVVLLPNAADENLEFVDVLRFTFQNQQDGLLLTAVEPSHYFDRKGGFAFYSW